MNNDIFDCGVSLNIFNFWFFIGLEVFKRNSYVIQLMFYLIYLNLQIAFAFFAAIGFSDAKTATGSYRSSFYFDLFLKLTLLTFFCIFLLQLWVTYMCLDQDLWATSSSSHI